MTFSIIIPVYNVAPYLRACLDSVAAAAERVPVSQDLRLSTHAPQPSSVEIICVNDGSTDGSGAILDGYAARAAERGPSFVSWRVLHQENAGVGAARNAGIEKATGDYFFFVDSDDVVRDTLFADVAAALSVRPEVGLVGFGLVLFSDGRPAWNERLPFAPRDIDLRKTIPDLMAALSAYRFAYRRASFADIRFPDYPRGEDLVYVARVLARADDCVYFGREEYGYRNRPDSAVHADLEARGVREAVTFHIETFRALAASGKRVDGRTWQMRIEQWVLRLPIALSGCLGWADGRRAWAEWRDSMRFALCLPCARGVCRVVAVSARLCPMPLPVVLLCRIGIRLSRWRRRRRL